MHPLLHRTLEDVERHFRADDRCLGLYLFGSAGRGTDDAYSDLDLAIVVRDEAYGAMTRELRAVCERICGPLQVWLPEGEREQFCNYAFLFGADGHLLLGDFSLLTGSFLAQRRGKPEDRILFDREGLLAAVREEARPAHFSSDRLGPIIDEYWVYAYINGKYWRRGDVYKLLYLQQILFQIHMRLLQAFHPTADSSWWAASVTQLSPERQEQLRVYFGASEPEAIAAALQTELDLFSQDAQAACQVWSVDYPQALEGHLRRHLRAMGLPVDAT
jgi:predicted nucleotidyltransferase